MQTQKLMSIISLIGVVLFVVAIIWWLQTFGLSFDRLKCIAVSSAGCKIGSGLKSLGSDLPAYNPVLFWVGVIAAVGGGILRRIL